MLYDPKWKSPVTPASRIAMAAADLIEKYGHRKFALGNEDEGYCLAGAIFKASNHNPRHSWNNIAKAISDRIGPQTTNFCLNAVNWNNQPERTKEEVIAMLREVAHVV